ncbi:NAD(P)-binding domain-containing protein [Streptomyces mirabilis]|uniref:NAD(P)-binding domain-containing protein n=1 Tax=Streptomyces mirabilis TaxID=68239 RepID=UPI0036E93DCA
MHAWNRNRATAEPLADAGAAVCDTAAEACQGADIVLTALANEEAVADVMDQARDGLGGHGAGADVHGLPGRLSPSRGTGDPPERRVRRSSAPRHLTGPSLRERRGRNDDLCRHRHRTFEHGATS